MLRALVVAISMLLLVGVASSYETAHFPFGGADGKKAAPNDRGKIVDQLRIKYQDVLDQLNKNDPGADTLAMQKEIADLLKRLLEQDDPPQGNPPPSSPPSGAKDPPPPSPQAQPKSPDAPKQPMPEQKNSPRQEKTAAHSEPMRGETDAAPKSLDEMKKQLESKGHWPLKLPRRHLENFDASGGGRFMPRYEELLRAYYRTIAESSQGKREE